MLKFLVNLFFKDRKNHRYLVHDCNFVVVVPTKEGTEIKWSVQVIDISLGGAAFVYEGSPADLAKSGLIRLSDSEAVKFTTISDVEPSEGSSYRRRGVKFEWKGVLGNNQIIQFINKHGLHAGGREGLRPPGRPTHVPGGKTGKTVSTTASLNGVRLPTARSSNSN
jgi:hypothetical protein